MTDSSSSHGGPGRSLRRRTTAILSVPLILLTVAAYVAVSRRPVADADRAHFEELVTAVGSRRLIGGQLVGDFRHGSVPSTTRGSAQRASAALLIAAARIEARLEGDRTPRTLNAAGMARLLVGSTDDAITAFAEAVAADPGNATIWANLAAAYLEKPSTEPSPTIEPLVRALDAGERAVALDPSLSPGWFNLALARQRALHKGSARPAWQSYLALETREGWRSEATAYLNAPGPSAPAWNRARAVLDDDHADRSATMGACLEFPGDTRTYVEETMLSRWAAAVRDRNPHAASAIRSRVALIGSCLAARLGDRFVAETAAGMPLTIAGSEAANHAVAYARFQTGRQLFEQSRDVEAGHEFAIARQALRSVTTPLELLVDLQEATLDYQHRQLRRAHVQLGSIVRAAQRRGFRSLEARAHIVLGSVLMQEGLMRESADEYQASAALVDPQDEPEVSATALYSLANTARLIGDSHLGWSAIARTSSAFDRIANHRRRYMILYNASMLAEHEGLLYAAKHFQDGALDVAIQRGVAGAVTEAYTRRAALAHELGRAEAAATDIASAEASLKRVGDPSRAGYYRGLLDATAGVQVTTTDPATGYQYLSRAIEFFSKAEPADLPKLFLHRGRASLRVVDIEAARRDFGQGIESLERLRARTSNRMDRISLFDAAWQLFNEMVALHLDHPDLAFGFAERGRARTLVDATVTQGERLLEPSQIAARLDEHSVILQYASLPNETLLWLVRRTGSRFFRIPLGSTGLDGMVTHYLATLRASSSGAEEGMAARRLYEALIAPAQDHLAAGDRLVIVGDGSLLVLPFGALVRPLTGHRLIEDFAITVAPSANLFLWSAAVAASSPGDGRLRVLSVGNPAFDRARFPQLRELPAAEREALEVGRTYTNATVLIGAAATKRRFLSELHSADVVHIASHAVVNEEYPMESELLFAAESGSESSGLSIEELGRIRSTAPRVVVLAACGTARGSLYRLEGAMSLARAFMEVGSPHVVATLWDVDDVMAEQIFSEFHRGMTSGLSPTDALRAAQLRLATGADPRQRSPRNWAPYIVFGGHGRTAFADPAVAATSRDQKPSGR